MEKISNCFICGSDNLQDFLICKDHLLNSEEFRIVKCSQCGFRFTNPRPSLDEIGKYYESAEYISHHAHKKGAIKTIYRILRNYSVRRKVGLLKKYAPGGEVLDIGCGTGEFLAGCSMAGYIPTGIEPNKSARKFATDTLHLNVLPEDAIPGLPDESFRIITMWHVLEHVHDLGSRMKRIKELLKPGDGTFIVALPNAESWDANHYKEFWAAYDLPRHLYHFTPSTFTRLAENFGFSLIEVLPLKLDAFYISMLSEKNQTGKQNYHRALISGLKSNFNARKTKNNYSSIIYILKPVNFEK